MSEVNRHIPEAAAAQTSITGTVSEVQPKTHDGNGFGLHIDMFTPGNLDNRGDLLARYWGRSGLRLVVLSRQGSDIFDPRVQEIAEVSDQHVFDTIQADLNLKDGTDMADFYTRNVKHSNLLMHHFGKVVIPYEENTTNPLNEVGIPDASPSEPIITIKSPDTDDRLRFEQERQLLLTFLCASIEARSKNSDLLQQLKRLTTVFSTQLYEGRRGQVEQVRSFAWHDNITNRVVELTHDTDEHGPENTHLKRHTIQTRRVAGIGNVMTDFGEKDITSAALKALKKAARKKKEGGDGRIDINEAVQDMIRGTMVVEGTTDIDDPRIDTLIAKVEETISLNSEMGVLGELESITRDDETTNNIDRFKRIQVKFKEAAVPVEIIFKDQKGAINSKYAIGERDPQTGHYNGQAHDLYEIQKYEDIIRVLYPKDIYDPEGNGDDLVKAAITAEHETAMDLLRSHRVNPITVFQV